MTGLGSQFAIYRQLNDRHYAAWHPDVFPSHGRGLRRHAVRQWPARCRRLQRVRLPHLHHGLPFECIKDAQKRQALMRGILHFLVTDKKTSKK